MVAIMAVSDNQLFSNITAPTSAFQIFGGRYSVTNVADGSWHLQRLGPDGSAYVNVVGLSDPGSYQVVELSPGMYRFNLSDSEDGAYIELTKV